MKRNRKTMGLLCLSLFLAACSPQKTPYDKEAPPLTVVTSFYPVYLLAQEVTAGVEGIRLLNMAQPQTGCLHDYELTIADMKLLEQADVLFINGGGMESFLGQALERYPQLQVVDTSEGIALLESGAHHHSHEEDFHEEVFVDEHDAQEGHTHEENSHIWLSPERAAEQVEAMAVALGERLPEERERFDTNAEAFHMQMHALEELAQDVVVSETEYAAIFHEGFGYLTELFHMEPAVELFADEYRMPSAKELAEATEEAAAHNIRFYLTAADDGQKYASVLAAEQGETVLVLDPLTTQDAETGSYTERMRKNIEMVKAYGKEAKR